MFPLLGRGKSAPNGVERNQEQDRFFIDVMKLHVE